MGKNEYNDKVATQIDINEDIVQDALKVITDSYLYDSERSNDYQSIFALFKEGIEISQPNGPRKINAQMLMQVLWKIVGRMKPLDFTVHAQNRPENVEKLVSDGIGTVLDEGGYMEALRGKGGAFINMTLLGDAMIHVGTNEDDDMPIGFNTPPLSNVYVDQFATKMRGKTGQNVTKMTLIYSYSWGTACKMFPVLKEKGGSGKIPREESEWNETNRSIEQTSAIQDCDLVEIAYSYNLDNDTYVVFAGSACTILDEKKDKDYPFKKNGKCYIPVLHYYLQPAVEGFWNYGIGHMLYRMSIIERQLMNMGVSHLFENIYPTTIVSLPSGQASRFFDDLTAAEEDKALGRRGFVTVEYDSTGGNQVSTQSMLTQSLFQEWQATWNQFSRVIARLGVNLDEIDRGANTTATQIMAEEESSNAFVKQSLEYNASEFKFAIEVCMDFIKEFVSKKNKTPLNSSIKIPLDNFREVEVEDVTLGDIAEELQKHKYFVRVNARSGTYPSNIFQQAQLQRVMGLLPQGSPAQMKAVQKLAMLNDQEFSPEDLGLTPPAGMPEGNPTGGPSAGAIEDSMEAIALPETERAAINPRSPNRTPAI